VAIAALDHQENRILSLCITTTPREFSPRECRHRPRRVDSYLDRDLLDLNSSSAGVRFEIEAQSAYP
jgi:hypothetical protein